MRKSKCSLQKPIDYECQLGAFLSAISFAQLVVGTFNKMFIKEFKRKKNSNGISKPSTTIEKKKKQITNAELNGRLSKKLKFNNKECRPILS